MKADLTKGVITGRVKQYMQRVKQIKDSTGTEEWKRFEQTLELFEKYGKQYNFDPLMLAAQGFQESQLNQDAKSHVGAVGVMQIMPATGKELKVGDIRITEPNIHAGAKYMDQLMTKYFPDAGFDEVNRTLFAFASYNAGPGNISKMRKAAEKGGLDPDQWFNNVEIVTAQKIGIETTTYVRNIYKYYVAYKLMKEAQEAGQRARERMTPVTWKIDAGGSGEGRMKRLVVLVVLALWAPGCSVGPGPKEVMGKYLDATYKGRHQEAYSLLSSEDKTAKSLDAFSMPDGTDNSILAIVGLKDTYQVTEVMTEGDRAKASVEVSSPDIGGAFVELLRTIRAKELAEKAQGMHWPTVARTEYYDLVKERDGWKVFLNYEGIEKSLELKKKAESLERRKKYAEAGTALEEAAKRNPRDAEIPARIKEMNRKASEHKEKLVYFDKVEVANVRVGQEHGDRHGVFGELKNRGDRTLREVEITVYFLDKEGNVVHEETHRPVSATDDPFAGNPSLKPNYARKFGYRVDGAPSDWAKKVKVAVTDVEFQE